MSSRRLPLTEAFLDAVRVAEINPDTLPRLPSTPARVESADLEAIQSLGHRVVITEKVLLTHPDSLKAVFGFKFRLSSPLKEDWKYEPGDSFDIYCQNNPQLVDELLSRLDIDGGQIIKLENCSIPCRGPVTTKRLLSNFVDITQYPKKALLRHLAEFCANEQEKKSLLFLSHRCGSQFYLDLATQYACLLDFLATFPSCKPDLECLLSHLPVLAPRSYSIITSPLQGLDIEFIATIDKYTTPSPDEQTRFGVCSRYLEKSVDIGDSLNVVPRPLTNFRLSVDPGHALLLVCAGSAVAPFIGFLRHRQALNIQGPCFLFYGFRCQIHDFLFKEELDGFLADGSLTKLFVATSREEPRQYVQDAMWAEKSFLFEFLMDAHSLVYLCGDEMSMIKGVNDTILRILCEHLDMEKSKQLLAQWNTEKKILRDIWL